MNLEILKSSLQCGILAECFPKDEQSFAQMFLVGFCSQGTSTRAGSKEGSEADTALWLIKSVHGIKLPERRKALRVGSETLLTKCIFNARKCKAVHLGARNVAMSSKSVIEL